MFIGDGNRPSGSHWQIVSYDSIGYILPMTKRNDGDTRWLRKWLQIQLLYDHCYDDPSLQFSLFNSNEKCVFGSV
jgi:hypothetical protein